MMRIGLIQFPGSNCERETALAIKRAGMEPVDFLWNEPLNKLTNLDGFVLIGGFSYEDRSRAGIIAALDPVMQTIKTQSQLGKPVLGICNGAQILVEAGFFISHATPNAVVALTENKRMQQGHVIGTGFYNTWVNLCVAQHSRQDNAFTRHFSHNHLMHLPIAHAEGRFVMPERLYNEFYNQGMIALQYCDEHGVVVDNFPINPNGTIGNMAAIINQTGNVMAMMPHPERTPNGDLIFTSMRDYITATYPQPLSYPLVIKQRQALPIYQKRTGHYECIIKLIITDNHALTVQKTLRQLGFPVTVRRFVHWDIACDTAESLQAIKNSGVLYCERKESDINLALMMLPMAKSYLVRSKDNLRGIEVAQTLKNNYAIDHITSIHHSILWQFTSNDVAIDDIIDGILRTNIISNTSAHDCFEFGIDTPADAFEQSTRLVSKEAVC